MRKSADIPPGIAADNKRREIEQKLKRKLLARCNLQPRIVLTALTIEGVTGNLIIPVDGSPAIVNFTPQYNWN